MMTIRGLQNVVYYPVGCGARRPMMFLLAAAILLGWCYWSGLTGTHPHYHGGRRFNVDLFVDQVSCMDHQLSWAIKNTGG